MMTSDRKTLLDCKTRKEFENYLFEAFAQYYGLTCTCDEGIETEFRDAASHYQRCAYWKFCHAVNRSLEWAAWRVQQVPNEN